MQKIVLASNNKGKIKELNELLADKPYEFIAQAELGVDEIEEKGTTFVENALLKARHASEVTGLSALADDSGLEIDALNGEPGLYSARYAGEHGNHAKNIAKVLANLDGVSESERAGRFVCVLALVQAADDPNPVICEGKWEGRILEQLQGENGFGYDPIFYVPTHDCSAAELDAEEKNRLSHRGQALQELLKVLK